jgi:hypothetical protein
MFKCLALIEGHLARVSTRAAAAAELKAVVDEPPYWEECLSMETDLESLGQEIVMQASQPSCAELRTRRRSLLSEQLRLGHLAVEAIEHAAAESAQRVAEAEAERLKVLEQLVDLFPQLDPLYVPAPNASEGAADSCLAALELACKHLERENLVASGPRVEKRSMSRALKELGDALGTKLAVAGEVWGWMALLVSQAPGDEVNELVAYVAGRLDHCAAWVRWWEQRLQLVTEVSPTASMLRDALFVLPVAGAPGRRR